MSLLKLDNFADALLNKYETTTLNEGLTDCGFMSNFNEDFFTEEKVAEVKPLNESFNGSINECSVFSLDEKKELTETVARSPRYELEDLGNLIEDAKAALEDKDMENMYLFGHTIYDFIEENKDELNEVVIDELGNLQDELEAEAQKLDESCDKNMNEGFSDDLFNKAVEAVKDFILDYKENWSTPPGADYSEWVPAIDDIVDAIKENMGEFNGLIGDDAEIIDVAATYFDLPSIVDAALDAMDESLEESNSNIEESVEDIAFYDNRDFKEDLVWLTNDLTDHFFKEMESAYWGISKKDITNVFNTALNNVLDKMRESDDCTLFEDCNKKEISEDVDVATARPNHMKILDAIDNGYIDYQMVAEELLRWMSDDKLADFVNMFIDYEDDLDEAVDARPNHTTILDMLESGALNYKETAEELLRWIPDDKLADFISLYIDPMFDELEESCKKSKLDESLRSDLYDKAADIYEKIISEYWGPERMNHIPGAKEVLEYCNSVGCYTRDDLDLLDVAEDLFDLDYLIEEVIEDLEERGFFEINESVEEIKPTHRGRKLHSEE